MAAADLKTLSRMLRWGAANGHIRSNGLEGFKTPMNRNPRRPVMTVDRYNALLKVEDQVRTKYQWNGARKPTFGPSYLGVLLVLAWNTGRRINAILQLREADFFPDRGPHGSMRWRADADKMKQESIVPLNEEARAAIDKQFALIRPNDLLFASPMKESKPVSASIARAWLRRAEELAELDHIPGGGWHMLRRGFVTIRKGCSEIDLAALGGWKTPAVMRTIYQQADFDTMVDVACNTASAA